MGEPSSEGDWGVLMVPVLAVSPLLSVKPLEANESDLRFRGRPWNVRRMAVGG